MMYLYGKTPAAMYLEDMLKFENIYIRRKVMTSISEYNCRIKQMSKIQDDDLYFYCVNLIPVDTKLTLPEKIGNLMRCVKIGYRRDEIYKRKGINHEPRTNYTSC